MLVFHSHVEQNFLAVFIKVTRKKRRFIRGQSGFVLADDVDKREVERSFARFQISQMTMEDYFDIHLIICRPVSKASYVKSGTSMFLTNVKKVTRRPIFMGLSRSSRNTHNNQLLQLISLSQVKSASPIEMSSSILAQLYGLPVQFKDLTDLYSSAPVNFNFYKLDGKEAIQSNELPGSRMGNFRQIKVGVRNKIIHWLPSSYPIVKKIYCDKPKCSMWFKDGANLKRHQLTCTDKSKVVAKQVIINLFLFRQFRTLFAVKSILVAISKF